MPASLCGVVGLKPTYGRVSKAGVFPLSYLFDHAGPITRTVEDAAIVLERDRWIRRRGSDERAHPRRSLFRSRRRGVNGIRVGVPRRYFYERLDPEVSAAVEAALGELGSIGATVRDVELPSAETTVRALFGLVLAEAKEIHAERLRTRPRTSAPTSPRSFHSRRRAAQS